MEMGVYFFHQNLTIKQKKKQEKKSKEKIEKKVSIINDN